MPKSKKYYKDLNKLKEYKYRNRKKNYQKGWVDSHRRVWSLEEDLLVLHSPLTDRELSKEITRSVAAIQVHRNKLKKLKNEFKLKNNLKEGVDLG